MTCEEVDRLVQEYLDGALDEARAGQLRSHAAACRRCAGLLSAYERLIHAAADLPVPAPAPDLVDRLVGRVAAGAPSGTEGPRSPGRAVRRRWRARGWVWAAAAGLLLMVLVGRSGRHRAPVPEPRFPPRPEAASTFDNVLAEAGLGLVEQLAGPGTDPERIMSDLWETGQSLVRETPAGLAAAVGPIGWTAVESFRFLWSGPAAAVSNGT